MPSSVTGAGGTSTVDTSVAGGEEQVTSPAQMESPEKEQRDVSGSTMVQQEGVGYQQ